jgi:hypothetical protein
MAPYESRVIDLQGIPLHSAAQTELECGLAVPTVTKIEAGMKMFAILDTRHNGQYDSPFLLVDEAFEHRSGAGNIGIRQDEPLMLGRGYLTDHFAYHPTVSRVHFSLVFRGLGIIVTNQMPKNETLLSGDIAGLRQVKDQPR